MHAMFGDCNLTQAKASQQSIYFCSSSSPLHQQGARLASMRFVCVHGVRRIKRLQARNAIEKSSIFAGMWIA
ncbi:MAG: hypothetical protein KGI67_07985 [Pseudomonadota bacterium]|nr:hypothetical protein [Pseudomonadota bacterium]